MNKNLILKEMKRNLKDFLTGSLIIISLLLMTMGMYSSMEENMALISELYSKMPKFLLEAINFRQDQWTSILGFYLTYFVYYIPLMGSVFSIYLGTKILSNEEQNKTAEFLLSRPLTREQIISSKLLVLSFYILVINILAFLAGMISCGIISDWEINIHSLIVLHTYGFLLCLFFGVLGFFITVLMKRAKAIIGTGIILVMGLYFFDMIIRISNNFKFLLYLTPFKYLDLRILTQNYDFEAWRLIVFIGSSGILIFLSFMFYRRKDILI